MSLWLPALSTLARSQIRAKPPRRAARSIFFAPGLTSSAPASKPRRFAIGNWLGSVLTYSRGEVGTVGAAKSSRLAFRFRGSSWGFSLGGQASCAEACQVYNFAETAGLGVVRRRLEHCHTSRDAVLAARLFVQVSDDRILYNYKIYPSTFPKNQIPTTHPFCHSILASCAKTPLTIASR
jgi:hypothetical protein